MDYIMLLVVVLFHHEQIAEVWNEGQSQAWNQRYTTICDNDASDTDLVIYFNISSNDPDRLRWSTTSSGVYTVTSSSQNGFDFDNWGVHLCMENRLNNFYTDAQIATSRQPHGH